MIVDTSALVAILTSEPERESFLDAIEAASSTSLSAGSLMELSAVVTRKLGELYRAPAEQLIAEMSIEVVPVTEEQGRLGWYAYREYGIGTGSPAKLNFGDCFAYALAKATGEPLLFKGDDFIHTDITPAIWSLAPHVGG